MSTDPHRNVNVADVASAVGALVGVAAVAIVRDVVGALVQAVVTRRRTGRVEDHALPPGSQTRGTRPPGNPGDQGNSPKEG